MGFDSNTQTFTKDPTLFDPAKLVDLVKTNLTPTAAIVNELVTRVLGSFTLNLNTVLGGSFNEDFTIEINDPNTTALMVTAPQTSPLSRNLQVTTGSYTINVKDTNGQVVATTTVVMDENGTATLTNNSLLVALGESPVINSLSSASGLVNSTLIINGMGFDTETLTQNEVSIGGQAAAVTAVTSTSLTVTVPDVIGGSYNLSLKVRDNASVTTPSFNVLPGITSLTDAGNPVSESQVGKTLTINGSGFDPATAVVKFGTNTATVDVNNSTRTALKVTVPGNTITNGAQNITVEVGTQTSAAANFTQIMRLPCIEPAFVPGGGIL